MNKALSENREMKKMERMKFVTAENHISARQS